MLTKERKAEMVESLKKDYVVLTDIVCEVVADTQADMIVLKRELGDIPYLEQDRQRLSQLDKTYLTLFMTDQKKRLMLLNKFMN